MLCLYCNPGYSPAIQKSYRGIQTRPWLGSTLAIVYALLQAQVYINPPNMLLELHTNRARSGRRLLLGAARVIAGVVRKERRRRHPVRNLWIRVWGDRRGLLYWLLGVLGSTELLGWLLGDIVAQRLYFPLIPYCTYSLLHIFICPILFICCKIKRVFFWNCVSTYPYVWYQYPYSCCINITP